MVRRGKNRKGISESAPSRTLIAFIRFTTVVILNSFFCINLLFANTILQEKFYANGLNGILVIFFWNSIHDFVFIGSIPLELTALILLNESKENKLNHSQND